MHVETSVNQFLESFVTKLGKDVDDFDGQLKIALKELTDAEHNLVDTLKKIDNDFKIGIKDIKKKSDILKAEVWRYKQLLEKYLATENSPQMQQRVQELETAIAEHAEIKQEQFTLNYNKNRSSQEASLKKIIADLEVKVTLVKEEIARKSDTHFNQFNEFIQREVDSRKGIAASEKLINFSVASYEASCNSIRLGSFERTLNFGLETKTLDFPVVLDFQDRKNLLVFYNQSTKSKAEDISDSIILRQLCSNLPDKFKLHLFDSQMFEKFREFFKLPTSIMSKESSFEKLFEEIGLIEDSIREKLSLVWSDIEDSHSSIHEYNYNKIKLERYDEIISYHFFVIDNFDAALSREENLVLFEKISWLTKYGVNFLILLPTDKLEQAKIKTLAQAVGSESLTMVDLTALYQEQEYALPYFKTSNLVIEDKKNIVTTFLEEFANIELNRAKLKFKNHFNREKESWFSKSAGTKVEAPLGKSLTREGIEYLNFTTKEGFSNALLCGGVGSGKTNLLRSIVTSIAINYSPNEVELYLIDMKNGAGFSVFQTEQLPHVKLFAFSAENELINDVLSNLKLEMDRRYDEYRRYNIDNLADVHKDPTLSKNAPKRAIVVIDEFASIFTGSDLYLDEISSNILNIVQRGRAMGINLLLATQNFNSINNSAFRQSITQIPTRILLKSSPDAAMSILGTGNSGYKDVTRIGEGFINYNFGEVNSEGGNYYFKSYLLDTDDLVPILQDVRAEVSAKKISNNELFFIDAAKQADFSTNALLSSDAIIQNDDLIKKNGIQCWMGESFLMTKDNHFSFNWRINAKSYNQNILISGNEREFSYQALYAILSSITHQLSGLPFSLLFLNPFDEEVIAEWGFDKVLTQIPSAAQEMFFETQLETVINKLDQLVALRSTDSDRSPVFVVLIGLERFVKLHSEWGNNDLSNQLKELMSKGSSYGVYFICEINRPQNLDKINRNLLSCYEHRICYFMNADESRYMIGYDHAQKLIDVENADMRSKAIYFSQANQSYTKFKSYASLHNELGLISKRIKIDLDRVRLSNIDATAFNQELSSTGSGDYFDISKIDPDLTISFDDNSEETE